MKSLGLKDFVGQESVKKDLQPRIDTANVKVAVLEHLLLCGPSQMGKSTLAHAIAGEMRVKLVSLEPKGRYFNLPNSPRERYRQILLIENVELLKGDRLSYIRDYVVGPGKQEMTLIATSSRPSQIDRELGQWLYPRYHFAPYTRAEISVIAVQVAEKYGYELEWEAAQLLSLYADGLPGFVSVLISRVIEHNKKPNDDDFDRRVLKALENGMVLTQARQWAESNASKGIIKLKAVEKALDYFGYRGSENKSIDVLTRLSNMSGIEFEEFVGTLFRRAGYSVEHTKAVGDHGIDLILQKDGAQIVVQCKRWSNSIGEPIVRDFYGALVSSGAKYGCIVTTAQFTPQAIEFAKTKPIKLLDINALTQWINRIKIQGN